jgi:hypothetical protein
VTDEERRDALDLMRLLHETALGERLILAGSSGLYSASEVIPALTEDLDFLVDADWVAGHEALLLSELGRLGFEHVPETCTFVRSTGVSIDLVGYSTRDREDRIGGGARIPVMVYGDLSVVAGEAQSIVPAPGGSGRALSPAALAAVKLLTVRVEKGAKDKLQALLLVEENARRQGVLEELGRLLAQFERDRVDDAVADAQAAFLGLSSDPLRSDPQSAGYAEFCERLERGLSMLIRLLASGALQ